MNFLAHLFLSGDNEEIIVGNFIADHVKGNGINRFNTAIKNGIYFHREIDAFTDNHSLFIQSKNRLALKYRKYSGVIVDMFYDHFLSANWTDYSNEPLEAFTKRMYKIVLKRLLILPSKTRRILPFMAKDNWLMAYGTTEGIDRALSGMAKRTPFESGMENAVNDLIKDYELYKNEFQKFFPDITIFSQEFLKLNND
ncbi:MAG: ACP phosphodiesterase [Bacteroidetes bacterium 4484_249]|nr:MAG: ACP phosphodiesterase [Bacteroidetes bacterium 4484_249]